MTSIYHNVLLFNSLYAELFNLWSMLNSISANEPHRTVAI